MRFVVQGLSDLIQWTRSGVTPQEERQFSSDALELAVYNAESESSSARGFSAESVAQRARNQALPEHYTWSENLGVLFSRAAFLEYLTVSTTPNRQLYALIYIYVQVTTALRNEKLSNFKIFFFLSFALMLLESAVAIAYVAQSRLKGISLNIGNADAALEFLESLAGLVGFGVWLMQPNSYADDDTIKPTPRWTLLSIACVLTSLQMLSGIKDKVIQANGHSTPEIHAVISRDPQDLHPSITQRMINVLLRLLHSSHVFVMQHAVQDALSLLFEKEYYFNQSPMHAAMVGVGVAGAYKLVNFMLLNALWAEQVPAYTQRLIKAHAHFTATLHLLLTFNAVHYNIVQAYLDWNNDPNDQALFNNTALLWGVVYTPSFLLAVAAYIKALEQHHHDIGNVALDREEKRGYGRETAQQLLNACQDSSYLPVATVLTSSVSPPLTIAQQLTAVLVSTGDTGLYALNQRDLADVTDRGSLPAAGAGPLGSITQPPGNQNHGDMRYKISQHALSRTSE